MKKIAKLWASVAIVTLVLGVASFILGSYVNIEHILSIPTHVIAATAFIVSNFSTIACIATNESWGIKAYEWGLYSWLCAIQGGCLGGILLFVYLFFPFYPPMRTAMFFPTVGMLTFGMLCFWLLLLFSHSKDKTESESESDSE